jgi:hypothetical protein
MSGHLIVAFTDICGSTRLYERLGDVEARARIRALLEGLRGVVSGAGGRVVKEIGDELMLVFGTPGALRDYLDELPRLQACSGMLCRSGVHAGEVIEEQGDLFGDAVNTAARIAGLAGAGQVLLSQTVLDQAPDGWPRPRPLPALSSRGKRRMPPLYEWPFDGGAADRTEVIDPRHLETLRAGLDGRLHLEWCDASLVLRPGCEDLLVGRDPGNPLCLALPQVSRVHLRIESRGPYWLVHDQSTNGTRVLAEGAEPVWLQRDHCRLGRAGVLELAPAMPGAGQARIRYRLL